jgi:hypothetical protein
MGLSSSYPQDSKNEINRMPSPYYKSFYFIVQLAKKFPCTSLYFAAISRLPRGERLKFGNLSKLPGGAAAVFRQNAKEQYL